MMGQDELIERVRAYDPGADEEALNRAYVYSMAAHGSQKRASGAPYFSHPVEVAGILAGYRLDTASIVTALLHDTVEDTLATLQEIRALFGDEVAQLVDGVTKLSKLELQSVGTEQAENFRKLLLAISEDIRVLLVKLADRLHNMRTLRHIESLKRRTRIARETMDIYAPLAARIGVQEIKEELEDLAFRELYPDECESIARRLDYLRSEGDEIVARISDEIAGILVEAEVEAWVSGRVKRPISVWRKMQRKHVPFERLTDIIAFRVVVASVDDCYKALGVIHTNYRVVPNEFDDYISTPKPNGYKSLHTAVVGGDHDPIEVQIRTTEMHDVAELGVAAHWQYKQGAALTEGKRYRWVSNLLDILESASSPDEFLENTKLEMYADQAFCFTPKGHIITLPQGATPIDFAYAVHSEIGDRCIGAYINGKMAPLRTELRNGDQVEIVTSADGAPSPVWEHWVATGKARARIRRHVRKLERGEFVQLGRAILDPIFQAASPGMPKRILERFGTASEDDLAEMVGRGDIPFKSVVSAVVPPEAASRLKLGKDRQPGVSSMAIPPRPDTPVAIPLRGLEPGVAVHYANCCHPLPGDRVVAILTRGKGASIHTRDCETLESFADMPERWLDVAWDLGSAGPELRVGRIELEVANERGALGALTTLIGRHNGNISNLKITARSEDFFRMVIDIEVESVRHLGDIVAALRTLRAIASVDRVKS